MIRTFSIAFLALLGSALAARAQTDTTPGGLLPGDIISIAVWREPDLSGQFTVQDDRTVVLPRLGDYSVVGKTTDDVERELIAEYSSTLRNPAVEVIVLKRIVISGEVRSPGLYPVDPTMTLTDALTLAGGPMPNARENRIILIRDGQSTTYELDEASRFRDIALQSGDQLHVPKKHWLVRNWQLYTSIVGTIMSITTFVIVGKR